jgi:hypothetical protein
MPRIETDAPGRTLITTSETTHGTAHDRMDALRAARGRFIAHQPGFMASRRAVNDAQTRMANPATRAKRDILQAIQRSDELGDYDLPLATLFSRAEPMPYDTMATCEGGQR